MQEGLLREGAAEPFLWGVCWMSLCFERRNRKIDSRWVS